MAKVFRNIILFFFLSLSSATIAQDKSILWEISGNGLEQPSYLFGTIHKICIEDYFWTDTMAKYFHKAEQVCFELDMGNPWFLLKTVKEMKSESNHTLRDIFSPKDFSRLAIYFRKSTGMELSSFNEFKPFVLLLFLRQGDLTCYNTTGYETELQEEAQRFDMPILGLETIKDQIDVLSSTSEKEIVKYAMDVVNGMYINDFERQKELGLLIAYYRKQDIEKLHDVLLRSETLDLLGTIDVLLDQRNKNWIPKIKSIAHEKPTFFAVGAGHLAGKNGVIQLLRNEGFTLKPLFSEDLVETDED